MVTDLFGSLLQELGHIMGIPELHPDRHNACLIKFPDGLEVQMELDGQGLELTMLSNLGILPPGKYRENVFREALRANGMPQPLNGTFAYSKKADSLVIFHRIPTKELSGDKINTALLPFLEKARYWRETIINNEIPVVSSVYTSSGRSQGMFGLRP